MVSQRKGSGPWGGSTVAQRRASTLEGLASGFFKDSAASEAAGKEGDRDDVRADGNVRKAGKGGALGEKARRVLRGW